MSLLLKKTIFVLFLICLCPGISAQKKEGVKYIDASHFKLLGKSNVADSVQFYRIRRDLWDGFPQRMKYLSKSTAGFNIMFKTNASSIHLKWKLRAHKILWNMTPMAVNGMDLYGWNGEKWQFVSSARPSDVNNSATFIENLDGEMRNYRIYLPLYTGVEKIEIGVDKESTIQPADDAYIPKGKIALYGSSITQGASASRPGMTFSSILGRKLKMDIFNLGFSGSGKMEIEVADVLSKIKPDLFILDCVPNPSVKQIKNRTIPFVERIRKSNPNIPILMVESLFRENGYWDHKKGETVKDQNAAFRKAYQSLKSKGIDQIYYLNNDDIVGRDHEATIDGVHFTDLGHVRMADELAHAVTVILGLKGTRK